MINKTSVYYKNIKSLDYECNCSEIKSYKWSMLMYGAVKGNKKIINKLIKKCLPELHENLFLNLRNPYPYLRTKTHLILVHSSIEYFLKIQN